MQLTDWLLIEVALLLIGLTQISLTKSSLTTRSCNRIAAQAADSVNFWRWPLSGVNSVTIVFLAQLAEG
jgi:hypothetical protein